MRRFTDLYGNLPARLILASILNAHKANPGSKINPVLLQGHWGTGKSTLADMLAAGFNCGGGTNGPCGECSSCNLTFSGAHPSVLKIFCRRESEKFMVNAALHVEMETGPMTRVLILEDVDGLDGQGVLLLASVLDTLPDNAAVIMTSHASPDESIISHALSISVRNIDQAEAYEMALALTKDAPEKIPASHVAKAFGNPRALTQMCNLWNVHPFVEEFKDHSVTMLRAILTGNVEGGMTATYEHVQDGGTYSEAVTALLSLITQIMEVRTVGGTKDPVLAELAGMQTEAQALAMLRTLWGQSAISFVVDPVVRLRSLFSILCSVAHPEKFKVVNAVTVVKEATPVQVPENNLVTSMSLLEDVASEAFGK